MTDGAPATYTAIRFRADLSTALLIVASVTICRIAALMVSPLDLGPDEAQYWHWSTEPAFGYFSKPPLIAWLIGATTIVCGDSEACVRSASPIMHAITSIVLFYLGQRLFDERVGFWCALTFVTLPAVSFSSGLISTDAPLLACWATALLSLHHVLERQETKWAIALGVALGFGLLAKYAMAYFILCLAIYALFAPRKIISASSMLVLAAIIALTVFSPNIIWNSQSGFATLGHTAANANLGADLFNFTKLAEFAISQFGVLGPILLTALAFTVAAVASKRSQLDKDDPFAFLLAFSVPILAVALTIAFVSRANANWAATAYAAGTVAAVAYLCNQAHRNWLLASFALHATAALVAIIAFAAPTLVDAAGFSNAVKQTRGWNEIGAQALKAFKAGNFTSISTDERDAMGALLYYARPREKPVVMWDHHWPTRNHYELTARMDATTGANTLFVTVEPDPGHIYGRFDNVEKVTEISARLDNERERRYHLFRCEGFKPAATR